MQTQPVRPLMTLRKTWERR